MNCMNCYADAQGLTCISLSVLHELTVGASIALLYCSLEVVVTHVLVIL
jgi:hypothetical protein